MNETSEKLQAEIIDAAERYPEWAAAVSHAPALHIAVMAEPFLTCVFSGEKTVESRFSYHRIAPYQRIKPGDVILMKAGPLVGCFTVSWIKYSDLAEKPIEGIAAEYNDAICGTPDFWRQKADKRYATLIGIRDVRRLPEVPISKRDRRAWLTLPAETP